MVVTMPLSDDQLRDIARAGNRKPGESIGVYSGGVKALRAVEAAVRADQIERDAKIASMNRTHPLAGDIWGTASAVRNKIAAAIRAQLEGVSNDE